MPAVCTDFCTARIHRCSKSGFLCQCTLVFSFLILSPPNSFTVKYWPGSIIFSRLGSARLLRGIRAVSCLQSVPVPSPGQSESVQPAGLISWGTERDQGLDFSTAPNPCGKPVAEPGIETFWFLAGAQQARQPEILTYQPVGVCSLHGYVFSNL